MAQRGWKRVALAGVLGVLGLSAGCGDRQKAREDARQAGKAVGKAAEDVRETTHEAVQGFKEGMGGSGEQGKDGAPIGNEPGVINDGEGPFEQHKNSGDAPDVTQDGQGPLEQDQGR